MVICLQIPTTFLNKCKNHYSQLLNVHRISDIRQIEIHTTELLVLDPVPFEVETAITKLKRYKSPGSNQIPSELIQARGSINLFILFGIRKNCLIIIYYCTSLQEKQ
jgi:hypothetical protein